MNVTIYIPGFADDVQYRITAKVSGGSKGTHDEPGESPDVDITEVLRTEETPARVEVHHAIDVKVFLSVIGYKAEQEITERILDALEDAEYAEAEYAALERAERKRDE